MTENKEPENQSNIGTGNDKKRIQGGHIGENFSGDYNSSGNYIEGNYVQNTYIQVSPGSISQNKNSENDFILSLLGENPDPNRELVLKYLTKVLKEIDDRSVTQALRTSFKDWPTLPSDDINKRIERFGSADFLKLIEALLDGNEKVTQSIREELEPIANSIRQDGFMQPACYTFQEPRTLESYLLIVLRPEIGIKKYRINAWLIPDNAVLTPEEPDKGFEPLYIDNEQEVSFIFEEIPQKVANFLEESIDFLNRQTRPYKQNFDLTIEIFLPHEYLCAEIFHWAFMDDPIEIQYQVLLRSSQRLNRQYLRKYDNQWRKNWHEVEGRLKTKLNKDDFYELKSVEECNWKKLTGDLKQKIGLKVACTLSKSKRQDVFQAIHNAAAPIAIWSRCDIPNLNLDTEINDFLNNPENLSKLPEWLRKTRENAYQLSEQYLGYDLSILWENPYRLPPDVAVGLLTPGE